MPKTYAILGKARIEFSYRTTVPQSVRELLKLEKDYKIVWIQKGDRILMDGGKNEVL